MEQNILEQILDGTLEPTDLPLETLRKITDNFSRNRIIGEGGFGTVYKGVLQNGDVAVKKIISSMTIDEKLFRREVDSLMEVNDHQNVVKFLGFCSHTVHTTVKNPESRGYIYAEKRERLICFEYISNGSLDKHITDELRGLEWDTRFKVIKGICTGLYYLHMEKHILHMDLKPANILLDNNMVPKITDFGLSRPTENSRTTSVDHFSSPGYCAPENLFRHGRMSVKSDIYSLGRIIIELVTGHKGIPDDNNKILRRWRHRWNKSAMETPLAYQQQLTMCVEIGIMCQSIDPYKRPFISDIMNKIGEMESMNNHIHDEPTIGQIYTASWKDDMLGIEPLELRFANYAHNNKHTTSCLVELSNNTNDFIAFNIQTTSPLPYCIDPNNNIVPPQSKLSVDITLQEATQNHDKEILQYNTKQYEEQFAVQSIKVNGGLTVEDINQDMFDKGKDVDEVHLTVVSEVPMHVTSCYLPSEEPNKEVDKKLCGDDASFFNQEFTAVLTDNQLLRADFAALGAKFMQAQEMLARAGLVPQGHIPLTPLQRQRMAALGATPTADATSSTFATPTAPFPSEAVETVTAAAVSDKRGEICLKNYLSVREGHLNESQNILMELINDTPCSSTRSLETNGSSLSAVTSSLDLSACASMDHALYRSGVDRLTGSITDQKDPSSIERLPCGTTQQSVLLEPEEDDDDAAASSVVKVLSRYFRKSADNAACIAMDADSMDQFQETAVVNSESCENGKNGTPEVSFDELMKTMESKDQGCGMPGNLHGGILVEQSYIIKSAELNAMLFSANSDFWPEVAEVQGLSGFQIDPWKHENDENSLKRTLTYTKAATRLVKSVKATEEQTYLKAAGNSFAVLSSVSTPDVPCGNYFKSEVMYCIIPGPQLPSEEQTSQLTISWRLKFLHQSTMLKRLLENEEKQDLRERYAQFTEVLSQKIKVAELGDAN